MTYRLRILHISDLHERIALDWTPPKRRRIIEINAANRARVLDEKNGNFFEVLRKIQAEYPVDLVCFTGDVADWGLEEEFPLATSRVRNILTAVGVPNERFFAVPGNHDIDRRIEPKVWATVRGLALAQPQKVSQWIAGVDMPDLPSDLRTKIASRAAEFWRWLERDFGRKDLHPSGSPHGTLGYRASLRVRDLPFPVHIVGFDSAWLAGDDHDARKLLLTGHQVDLLAQDGKLLLNGFRLALMHHPLGDLYDGISASSHLSRTVDLLLHGHQHEALATTLKSPDDQLHILAAGSLYEGDQGDRWINGFQCVDAVLDDAGRPEQYDLQFWAWSPQGRHWYRSGAIYQSAADGKLTIPVVALPPSPPPPSPPLSGSLPDLRKRFLGADPLLGHEALEELIARGDEAEIALLEGSIPVSHSRQVIRRWIKYIAARGPSATEILLRRLLDVNGPDDVRENPVLFAGVADLYTVESKLEAVLAAAFDFDSHSRLYELKTAPYLHHYPSILAAYGYAGGSVSWLRDFAVGTDFCWEKLGWRLFKAACASFARCNPRQHGAVLDFLIHEEERIPALRPRHRPKADWLALQASQVAGEAYRGAFDLWQSGEVADEILRYWSRDASAVARSFGADILTRFAFSRLNTQIQEWLEREADRDIAATLRGAIQSAQVHEAWPEYGNAPHPVAAVDAGRIDPYGVINLARNGHRAEGLDEMLVSSDELDRGSSALALGYLKDSRHFAKPKRRLAEASTPIDRVFLATAMAIQGIKGISLHDVLVEAAEMKYGYDRRVEVRWLLPELQLAILDGLAVSATEAQFEAWKREMEAFA